jgi:hypothetical protein
VDGAAAGVLASPDGAAGVFAASPTSADANGTFESEANGRLRRGPSATILSAFLYNCTSRENPYRCSKYQWRMTERPRTYTGRMIGIVAPATALGGKIHRVDPDFGSTLTASKRDSQSNCWVNWKIMGEPCKFQVLGAARATGVGHRPRRPSAGAVTSPGP